MVIVKYGTSIKACPDRYRARLFIEALHKEARVYENDLLIGRAWKHDNRWNWYIDNDGTLTHINAD